MALPTALASREGITTALVPLARRISDWIDLQWSLTIESLESVAPLARGQLLDVGCGDKPYEKIFLPHVDKYVGVEHEATFSQTNADGRAKGPDVLYDGDRLPFPDASFDTVLSVQVLEHTRRPAELVAEMARVLKADGNLILTAPFSFRLHEEPHDYFRYSPHGLRELCERAGLQVVRIERQGGLWTLIGHKVNSYLGLEVVKIGAVAQAMGKLAHEKTEVARPRWWALPVVAPTMAGIALAARVGDKLMPDPTESLGFLVVARHRA